MKRVGIGEFQLSTGKKIYPDQDVIGMSPSLTSISGGYGIKITTYFDEKVLTFSEQAEVAEYMLGVWGRFKIKAEAAAAGAKP